jgi:hypothetical protein
MDLIFDLNYAIKSKRSFSNFASSALLAQSFSCVRSGKSKMLPIRFFIENHKRGASNAEMQDAISFLSNNRRKKRANITNKAVAIIQLMP